MRAKGTKSSRIRAVKSAPFTKNQEPPRSTRVSPGGSTRAGVFRSLRPRGPLDTPEEIEGACLEVDFVLYGEAGLLAIEIKRSAHIREPDLRALRAFKADYPMARTLLFCGVEQRMYRKPGIELWPLAEALPNLGRILCAEVPTTSSEPASDEIDPAID